MRKLEGKRKNNRDDYHIVKYKYEYEYEYEYV